MAKECGPPENDEQPRQPFGRGRSGSIPGLPSGRLRPYDRLYFGMLATDLRPDFAISMGMLPSSFGS